ncbi:MAG: hypothetical protein J6X10_03680 [Bacteroidales bacterium]|nr:hypothetical protein [Bacteroidales bacterium]
MKYNEIMPECFIDTTLVSSLLDAKVSHKHSCNEVAKEMESGKYKDAFAVGIIDNDKRKLSYIKGFEVIGQTDNLTFLKHKDKHHYVIKIGQERKAMETFIKANIEAIGMKMEDFDLPSDLDELIEQTKNSVSTQKDSRILNMCKALRRSPEVTKLQEVLAYLAVNRYDVDIEVLKGMIA